ncbi:hypothetical protein E4K10_43420 [Streptomyces sp. T1317-0309]|nr:hypothetical protein E4K10_43420 [Streptomyces sp. T1317-0309]
MAGAGHSQSARRSTASSGSRSSGPPAMSTASRLRPSAPLGWPKASSGYSLIQRLMIELFPAISQASPSPCARVEIVQ